MTLPTEAELAEYRAKLEAEVVSMGKKAFRRKYGATQHALNPHARIQKAVLSDLDRISDAKDRRNNWAVTVGAFVISVIAILLSIATYYRG